MVTEDVEGEDSLPASVTIVAKEVETPSAPTPGMVLFKREEQSDIVFIVGTTDSETWRFPAHSFVLSDSSPVFANIINTLNNQSINNRDSDGLKEGSNGNEIMIHCRPEIFNIMLRYIYKKEIKLNSVPSTLNLIPVANQFELHDLTQLCFEWLRISVTSENVFDILSFLRKPQSFSLSLNNQDNEENVLNELIVKCCFILDSNCEEILKSDSIYQLDQELLMEILTRDTLVLSSELIVFEALINYANHQCLKQRKPLTAENKREVLGKALYSARYLVMPMSDFMKGPYSSDLLTDEEKGILLNKLKCQSKEIGFDCINLPMHMLGLKLDLPRAGLRSNSLIGTKKLLKSVDNSCQTKEENKKKSLMKRFSNGFSKFAISLIQVLD